MMDRPVMGGGGGGDASGLTIARVRSDEPVAAMLLGEYVAGLQALVPTLGALCGRRLPVGCVQPPPGRTWLAPLV